MNTELEVLKIVCQKLEMANVAYMLTGSFAANFYAVPRMTRDIDIVIQVHQAQAEKIFQVFRQDFYVDKESISDAIEWQGMFNVIHNDSVLKIDFIISKENPYRETEFQRRKRLEFDGTSIWIVAPEDLIISKLIWAKDSFSEIQINDIKNLLQSDNSLDNSYIKKWVDALQLQLIYEKVNVNA